MLEGTVSCTWMLLAAVTASQLLSCRDSELVNSICSLTRREVKETSQTSLAQGQHLDWHDKGRNVGIDPRVADRGEMPHCSISPVFGQVSLTGNCLHKLLLDSILRVSTNRGNLHLQVQM